MKVSVIGIGRLGLCYALSLEEAGFEVLGVDLKSDYLGELRSRSFKSTEPSVEHLLNSATRLSFSDRIEDAFQFSDLIFCFVATPSLPDHRFDSSQIESILERSKVGSSQRRIFVVGSTVMPKTCDRLANQFAGKSVAIVYSPSFIAQGNIIHNIQNPDMVLIGEGSKADGNRVQEIYARLCKNQPKVHRMPRTAAEITKLALNCFVTHKIAFANAIGDLAITAGESPALILKAVGDDSRIGNKYFDYGYGFGGPCFPRDNRALSVFSEDLLGFGKIFEVTDEANRRHLDFQETDLVRRFQPGSKLEIGPVSYNRRSPSLEESQSLELAVRLAKRGYLITIVDGPEVIALVRARHRELFEYRIGEKRCLKDQLLFVEPVDSSEAISLRDSKSKIPTLSA